MCVCVAWQLGLIGVQQETFEKSIIFCWLLYHGRRARAKHINNPIQGCAQLDYGISKLYATTEMELPKCVSKFITPGP